MSIKFFSFRTMLLMNAIVLFHYCNFASAGRGLAIGNQSAAVVHKPAVAGNVPAKGFQTLHNTHGGQHHPIVFNHPRFAHKPADELNAAIDLARLGVKPEDTFKHLEDIKKNKDHEYHDSPFAKFAEMDQEDEERSRIERELKGREYHHPYANIAEKQMDDERSRTKFNDLEGQEYLNSRYGKYAKRKQEEDEIKGIKRNKIFNDLEGYEYLNSRKYAEMKQMDDNRKMVKRNKILDDLKRDGMISAEDD